MRDLDSCFELIYAASMLTIFSTKMKDRFYAVTFVRLILENFSDRNLTCGLMRAKTKKYLLGSIPFSLASKYRNVTVPSSKVQKYIKYEDIKVASYRSIKVSKNQSIKVPKYQGIEVSKYQSVEVSKYQSIEVPKYQSIKVPK